MFKAKVKFGVQDQVPPFPSETPIAIVEEEFGSPLASVFDHFEYVPISATKDHNLRFNIVRAPSKTYALKIRLSRIDV